MESSNLGAFSSYALSVLKAQLAVIKANSEMQQQVVDMVLENTDSLKVASSPNRGNNVDVSI